MVDYKVETSVTFKLLNQVSEDHARAKARDIIDRMRHDDSRFSPPMQVGIVYLDVQPTASEA